MKLMEFTYTKKDKSVSQRALLVTSEPQSNYMGIDVSDVDVNDLPEIAHLMSKAKEEYLSKLAEIFAGFDIKHNYRQFIPANMTNVTTDHI